MKTPTPRKLQQIRNRLVSLYNASDEEKLEEVFYNFINSLGIDVDSDEYEELTNGGGMLSSEEMIKVVESLMEVPA